MARILTRECIWQKTIYWDEDAFAEKKTRTIMHLITGSTVSKVFSVCLWLQIVQYFKEILEIEHPPTWLVKRRHIFVWKLWECTLQWIILKSLFKINRTVVNKEPCKTCEIKNNSDCSKIEILYYSNPKGKGKSFL